MKIDIELHDWVIQDIKRLIAEATAGPDGMPVHRNSRAPEWIGAASAHLCLILEKAEKAQA